MQEGNMLPDRAGINITKDVKRYADGEREELAPEIKERVLAFEERLTRGNDLVLANGEHIEPMEKIWRESSEIWTLYADYFLTPAGKEDLRTTCHHNFADESVQSVDDVHRELVMANLHNVSPAERNALIGRARNYADNRTITQFESHDHNTEYVKNPTKITLFGRPESVADCIEKYYKLKEFHKEQIAQLRDVKTPEAEARLLMLNMHKRKVNERLATLYVSALNILRQHDIAPTEETHNAVKKIRAYMKNITKLHTADQNHRMRTLSRFDTFKYGKGRVTDSGDYSPLSDEAVHLAKILSEQTENTQRSDNRYFDNIDPERFTNTMIDAQQIQQWITRILSEYGLLSEEPEYAPGRAGRAADDKWQVYLNPTVRVLSVNGKRGIINVPHQYSGNIEDTVAVLDHEITHVIQHENKRRLGLAITKNIGMDRSSVFFEAGAMAAEQEIRKRLFGSEAFTAHPHYLRAIEEKLRGGSYKECVKAFYVSAMKRNPSSDAHNVLKEAVDRVARLFKGGGNLMTRPAIRQIRNRYTTWNK